MAQPPALQESIHNSTAAWQANLKSLFDSAHDRFPDVVWELIDDDNDHEVWGHKGNLLLVFLNAS